MGLMVAVNVICSGIIAVLLVELARHACRTAAGPVFALVFYLACYEVFQWIHFVLTDLVFCAASLIPFYLVVRPLIVRRERVRWPALFLSTVVALLTRPPGVLLVPFILFVVLVLMKRSVSAKVAAAVIFLVVVAALVVRTAAVYDPANWPFRFIKPKIVEFSNREKTGEVIYDRRESFRPPPRTPADHLVIVGDRFVRFFQITTSSFSRVHNAINLAYFLPLYALGVAGIFFAFRNGQGQKELVIAILMWIGIFAFLHALTSLDFDWRCRAPLMPHFILLAACGLDGLALRWFPGAAESAR
jgi:4-amino-4-deoxy-L-arabinose transferase-like glycosyltransferase